MNTIACAQPRAWLTALTIVVSSQIILFSEVAHAGTTYTFTASCQDARRSRVVIWGVGDVDPGKEFLQVSTGTNFLNCSITDYVEVTDQHLPREHYRHAEAFWKGIPLIGTLLCKFFC